MSQTDQDKATAAHGKIIARAWRDPAFKAKLMADPHATLKEAGVAVPAGVTVTVLENTAQHFHLVLPPKPTGVLSDEALDGVSGGYELVVGGPDACFIVGPGGGLVVGGQTRASLLGDAIG